VRGIAHVRYADVVATVALFIALGGTGYAAGIRLGPNAVHTKNIAPNAVTSPKVKNGSLLANDFKAGQLPAGAKGETGSAGPAGAAGPKGDAGAKGATGAVGPAGGGIVVATSLGAQTDITASCTSGATVTVVAPQPGTIVVEALVQAKLNHSSGTQDVAMFNISDAPDDCFASSTGEQSIWTLPSLLPDDGNYRNAIGVRRVFSVSAGSHTYDLNTFASGPGQDPNDEISGSEMTAVYYPS
jgi:hypothetical protein